MKKYPLLLFLTAVTLFIIYIALLEYSNSSDNTSIPAIKESSNELTSHAN